MKMSSQLGALSNPDLLKPGQTVADVKTEMSRLNQIQPGPPDLIHVYVSVADGNDVANLLPFFAAPPELASEWNLIAGWVEEGLLADPAGLAIQPEVIFIKAVDPPRFRTGSVTTAGDALHNGPTARGSFNIDGAPIHVGVISDGVSNASSAQTTNDLPASLNILSTGSGDEGTAMLEIIHDIAPGAALSFHAAGSSTVSFKNAITALHGAGCDIICDDVGFYTDPFFEFSPLGTHIGTLQTTRSYVHVSAAGNDALNHHQLAFTDSQPDTSHDQPLLAHVASGESLDIFMQWDETLGITPANDYDMYIFDLTDTSYTTPLGIGGTNRGVVGETIYYTNTTGAPVNVVLWIQRYSGTNNRTLEVMLEPIGPNSYPYSNNITAADSIFGHPGGAEVIAVASTDVTTPDQIEIDSSQGPFTTIGLFTAPLKPDVAAADGVAVTGAGSFPSTFWGTSAAAPHVAGICALAWSYSPTLPGWVIQSAVPVGASIDLPQSSPPPALVGPDTIFGHGRPLANLWAALLNRPPVVLTPPMLVECSQQRPTAIPGVSVSDPDAGLAVVQVTFTALNGMVSVNEFISGGIMPGQAAGNGTPIVIVTAPLLAINTTLAGGGLSYQANMGFVSPGTQAPDVITVSANDMGASGLGGSLFGNAPANLQVHEFAYLAWQFEKFTPAERANPKVSGDQADPDGDQYGNIWEFFMGLDPRAPDLPGEMLFSSTGTQMTYQFRVDQAIQPHWYSVNESPD